MKIKDPKGKVYTIPDKYRDQVAALIESGDEKAIKSFVKKMQKGGRSPVNLDGYNPDSPNRHNPFNIIPGNSITMDRVPHPIMGMPIDGNGNVGQPILMKPGSNHKFPGAQAVLEVPTQQYGTYPYEDPTMNPDLGYLQPDLPYGIPKPRTMVPGASVIQGPRPEPIPGLEPPIPADYAPFPMNRPAPIPGLEPQPPADYAPSEILPPGSSLDDLIAKYNEYIDKADAYNEAAYPKSLEEYAQLNKKLRGYANAQFASSALGTLLQNPYTQAAYLDQGFADAQRTASRMPQYLVDVQRAHGEAQMADMANRLISNGAKPTEVASLMAPYYEKLTQAQNEMALKRFQVNSEADREYYSFLTEIGNKNTLSDVQNKNAIIQAQNKQIQNFADTTTDRFRNMADLAAQEVEMRRSAEKQYTDNMFKAALMRLGIAGPELEYRMRERELQQNDKNMEQVMDLFLGNKAAGAEVKVSAGGDVEFGGDVRFDVPDMGGGRSYPEDGPTLGGMAPDYVQPWYSIPDDPTAWRSYPEDNPNINDLGAVGGGRQSGPAQTPPPPQGPNPFQEWLPSIEPSVPTPPPPMDGRFSVTDSPNRGQVSAPSNDKKAKSTRKWTTEDAANFIVGKNPNAGASQGENSPPFVGQVDSSYTYELLDVLALAAKNPERSKKVKWISRTNPSVVLWDPTFDALMDVLTKK